MGGRGRRAGDRPETNQMMVLTIPSYHLTCPPLIWGTVRNGRPKNWRVVACAKWTAAKSSRLHKSMTRSLLGC